jgi:hypothetical protein
MIVILRRSTKGVSDMAFIAAPRTILAAACAAYVLGVVSTVSADQIAQRGKALSSQEIQQQLQVLGFNSGPIGGRSANEPKQRFGRSKLGLASQ